MCAGSAAADRPPSLLPPCNPPGTSSRTQRRSTAATASRAKPPRQRARAASCATTSTRSSTSSTCGTARCSRASGGAERRWRRGRRVLRAAAEPSPCLHCTPPLPRPAPALPAHPQLLVALVQHHVASVQVALQRVQCRVCLLQPRLAHRRRRQAQNLQGEGREWAVVEGGWAQGQGSGKCPLAQRNSHPSRPTSCLRAAVRLVIVCQHFNDRVLARRVVALVQHLRGRGAGC
jgi:hypothetical protein